MINYLNPGQVQPAVDSNLEFELYRTTRGHRCSMCKRQIKRGTLAARVVTGKDAGDSMHIKGCTRTYQIWKAAIDAADEAILRQPENALADGLDYL